jgi:hypothetical protein
LCDEHVGEEVGLILVTGYWKNTEKRNNPGTGF